MAQYIDKSVLVAEIEWLKTTYKDDENIHHVAKYNILVDIISFLNTLEVKEVDINKEISQFIDANFEKATIGHKLSLRRVAKHFYELGLSVNNPITASDRGTAEEIIINLKRVEQDYKINLTKEIEWVRSQIKKEK